MFLKKLFAGAATAALLATASVSAHADFIDVDLTGWETFGDFGVPNNTSAIRSIGVGSEVTGFDYSNLSFTTSNGSFLSEFTLSVNTTDTVPDYIDWSPSLDPVTGTFGPGNGSWGGSGGPGPFGAGAPFVTADGDLFITVYEGFDDPFGDNGTEVDATVTSGNLRIFFTPTAAVPEASTYAMMLIGLDGLGAVARRRKTS